MKLRAFFEKNCQGTVKNTWSSAVKRIAGEKDL